MIRMRRLSGWRRFEAPPDATRRIAAEIFVIAILVRISSAEAQTREPESLANLRRQLDEQIERQRREELGAAATTNFEYGGWYSLNFLLFDDGLNSSRTLRRHDLRLWGRLTLDEGAHEFYARLRSAYVNFNTGDSYDGNDDDWEGMNLERGSYRFDLSRAATAYGWDGLAGGAINFTLVAGRDLVEIGTGLALSLPLDHVALEVESRDWALRGFAGRAVGSAPDVDGTRPLTRTRRSFFGTELAYTGLDRHEPFVYALWQSDHNDESFPTLLQQYDYDSFYAGAGSRGEIAPNLAYQVEGVLESGHSFGHGAFSSRDPIRAWSANAQLEYLFSGPHKGRLSLEYLFGSGDDDRRFSPTDALGGNTPGAKDTSFVAFGYRDTGLALAPRYSNLHLWRLGGSLIPWPDHKGLEHVELGSNVFLFQKHHRTGAISDPTADVPSGYLGWEWDGYANWELAHDFSWTVRFGAFFPGNAFDDQTTRTFFVTGIVWEF